MCMSDRYINLILSNNMHSATDNYKLYDKVFGFACTLSIKITDFIQTSILRSFVFVMQFSLCMYALLCFFFYLGMIFFNVVTP